ncbi:hypothetical protein MPSEU_000106900 [Mayamaea pseudoterrestris]|nr:hypothetical protein MPSEU_000106900 [Mayamaea pseudoterrestris]
MRRRPLRIIGCSFIVMFFLASTRNWRQATCFVHNKHLKRNRISISKATFISSTRRGAANSRWNVGDFVRLKHSNETSGTIQQVRGSGWYTIKLHDHADDKPMSVRGTQLLAAVDVEGTTSSSHHPVAPSSRSLSTASDSETTLPQPPTIHDLDALLQDPPSNVTDATMMAQLRHFSTFDRWIVLTDLHCAPSSLTTCLQVLDRTHSLASERGAGVLFLGDFWHQRGVLRVDCLNAVLESLQSWTVPLMMIPGNHDQITLRGHEHGLTPLANAYRIAVPVVATDVNDATTAGSQQSTTDTTIPGILIFSHATKFHQALFVPHMRDAAIMESIVQSPQALSATALFLHADVTGAYMNDMVQSSGGVPPSMFPSGKHIYSGHFHKPHVVESSHVRIEYLGSPYQVSLSEAHQDKALAVMSAMEGWKCVEKIPMDIGRRHFRVVGTEQLMKLSVHDESTIALDGAASLRTGDRVVCSLSKREMDSIDRDVERRIHQLRKAGVAVELREVPEQTPLTAGEFVSNSAPVENLSPKATWKAYLDHEVEREAIESSAAEALLASGLELLDSVTEDNEKIKIDAWEERTELNFDSVTLEGFGPFRTKQTYPLRNRGLVLLRGNNQDGGADSNGSGKSLLAMSTLWCFTGSLDARPMEDSKVSDIINDECKTARVTVQGELNGVGFSVTRSKTSSKSGLIFLLDGQDVSAQSAKETQALFEEKLGVDARILARTIFHGQHSIDDLLEATDTKLKDELSMLVPLNIWQEAAAKARKLGRAASKRIDEIRGMLTIRTGDLDRLKSRASSVQANVEMIERALSTRERLLAEELETGELSRPFDISALGSTLETATNAVRDIEEKIAIIQRQKQVELLDLQKSLEEAVATKVALDNELQSLLRQRDILALKLDSANESLMSIKTTWNIDLSQGVVNMQMPDSCPTCGQPLTDEHVHHSVEEAVGADAIEALASVEKVEAELADLQARFDVCQNSITEAVETLTEAQAKLRERETYWNQVAEQDNDELLQARQTLAEASTTFTSAAGELQKNVRLDELKAGIDKENERLRYQKESLLSLTTEMEDYERMIDELHCDVAKERSTETSMADLSNGFSPRGVQTFVLQSAILSLQNAAQSYLNDFSDGSQKLEMTLDMGDRISRRAFVRDADGNYRERALASLSGGQWRRCSLALNLGFSDLVARRGQLRPSLCVLDEPLTHLDRTGRSSVGRVLRDLLRRNAQGTAHSLSVSTILLILQDLTAEELEESFDCIDEVVKKDGYSHVVVDEGNL